MVQIVPPAKTTMAVRIMGIDAIFALMLRKSCEGRLAPNSLASCGESFGMFVTDIAANPYQWC